MPVAITTVPDKTPVPFAKTKEYQDLQAAINNAKQSLDDVSRAVVAIEAKMNPPQADLSDRPVTRIPDLSDRPVTRVYEDLNEMLRIAGLRN